MEVFNRDYFESRSKLHGEDTLFDVYNVGIVRAGFLVLHGELGGTNELLLVQERGITGKKPIPARYGPPKGIAEKKDFSAFATAERELLEETGIDIYDPKWGAWISPMMLVVRPNWGREVIIYFTAFVKTKPSVQIDNKEIIGYKWVSIDKLKFLPGITQPSSLVFDALVNMKRPEPQWWKRK